jgi:sterol desaturase/sphingolipid hydroxylase (fatty acid hydroxylase superfamily)
VSDHLDRSLAQGWRGMRSVYSDECLRALDEWREITPKPSRSNREHREGIPIFRNPWLDYALTKAHPTLPWVWSVPIAALGLYRGIFVVGTGVAGTVGLFLAGVALWTLIEYLLHRFLFHFVPPKGRLRAFFFLAHGYHHEFPDDRLRLVAPPLMFWTLALSFGLAYYLVFGGEIWAQLFAGTVAGYLAYDCIHFYAHHAVPRTRLGKWLRSYHLLHHFQDTRDRFGISSPLWDVVFRTYRGPGSRGGDPSGSAGTW